MFKIKVWAGRLRSSQYITTVTSMLKQGVNGTPIILFPATRSLCTRMTAWRQNKKNLYTSSCSIVYIPWSPKALVNGVTFCSSWVPQLPSVWREESLNQTVIVGKRSSVWKMLENLRMCRRFFWRSADRLNSSGQTRDPWTTRTKQENSRGSSR